MGKTFQQILDDHRPQCFVNERWNEFERLARSVVAASVEAITPARKKWSEHTPQPDRIMNYAQNLCLDELAANAAAFLGNKLMGGG